MSSLVTQEKLDEFQVDIDLLERGIRDHIQIPIGKAHVPKAGFKVVAGSTYKNSSGTFLGNATLQFTIGDVTYYAPARIIT